MQTIEEAERTALLTVTVRPGMPVPGAQLPESNGRAFSATSRRVLTPDEAGALAANEPKAIDSEFLWKMYERYTFLRTPLSDKIALRQCKATDLGPIDVEDEARRYLAMVPPDLREKISLGKMMSTVREHMDASSEMFGNYPKSLKKWSILVLPDYSDLLSEVTFAAFRLDELNACTVRLPSGGTAVIINTSFAAVLPAIVSAFIWIHEIGANEPGVFSVSSDSEHARFVLKIAKAFGTCNYDSLPELMQQAQLRQDGMEIASYATLATVLHECAHILLGHLDRRGNKPSHHPGVSWYNLAQEHEADDFALNALLQLDERPSRESVLYWSLAFGILYAFQYLCMAYSNSSAKDNVHPNSANRWLRVRPRIVKAMGGEGDVRRLEHVMQSLSTMQMLEMLEGEHGGS